MGIKPTIIRRSHEPKNSSFVFSQSIEVFVFYTSMEMKSKVLE